MLEKREGWGQTPLGRAGGWLFRHRTALPLPIAVALLAIPSNQTQGSRWAIPAGVILTSAGELLRLWGVWHIGVVSRTRSNRLGPLIESGPFALQNLHSRDLSAQLDFRVGAPWAKTALVTGYGVRDLQFNPTIREFYFTSAYAGIERRFSQNLTVRAIAEDVRAWRVDTGRFAIAQALRPAASTAG